MHAGCAEDWATWTIRSFLLSCGVCFVAAFWITLSWWWQWLVALLALTAGLTVAFALVAMLAPSVMVFVRNVYGASRGQIPEVKKAMRRKKLLMVGAKITVVWGDEPRTIVLSPRDWQRVKAGAPVTVRGDGYIYHEQWFGDIWRFNGAMHELVVDYDYSHGETGVGYNGSLSGVHIIEGP